MLEPIPLSYQTLYSELAQRSLDAAFTSEFSSEGRFISMESRGRRYWYFDTASGLRKKRLYVGPVDDPVISERVANFKGLKADLRARRRLVSTLTREAYLPRPEAKSGDVVAAVADAGFFRLRGVLVGTVAYQCFSPLLGVRLPNTAMQTADADFAQFHAISAEVADTVEPILAKLKLIDPTFREVPHHSDHFRSTQLVAHDGYRVDFLTPNTGSDDFQGKPAPMPALDPMAAEPLRFLDFLIHQPERAVLLHGAGVPVLVPSPERSAIHKLIVATRRLHDRNGLAKTAKDRLQAKTIIEAMHQTRRTATLADVFAEAWDRGPSWQEAIRTSLDSFDVGAAATIRGALREGLKGLDLDPGRYDLSGDVPP